MKSATVTNDNKIGHNKELLNRYQRDLALRGYSSRTQDHYFRNARQFLNYYDQPVELLNTEKIKDYLYYLITMKGVNHQGKLWTRAALQPIPQQAAECLTFWFPALVRE